jgi:hypothetical protein
MKPLSYITPRNPKATPATTMMIGIAMFHQLGSGTLARSGFRSGWFAKGMRHSTHFKLGETRADADTGHQ